MTDKTDSKKAAPAAKKAAPAPAAPTPVIPSQTDRELSARWGYDHDRWGNDVR
jgi:hypothetical protein